MLNPEKRIVKSEGVDIPLMKAYLVGRISGNCMDKCTKWRKQITEHYMNYKDRGAYPISFMCPLASGESKTADALGLKSHLPKNLIYDKDILSLLKADIIIANLDDFMEDGIEDIILRDENEEKFSEEMNFKDAFFRLHEKIKNRRPNLGSHFEVSVALYLRKPVILIAGNEHNKYILENHPFFGRASVIVLNVEQLLKEKWIQVLYKAMAGSLGDY